MAERKKVVSVFDAQRRESDADGCYSVRVMGTGSALTDADCRTTTASID